MKILPFFLISYLSISVAFLWLTGFWGRGMEETFREYSKEQSVFRTRTLLLLLMMMLFFFWDFTHSALNPSIFGWLGAPQIFDYYSIYIYIYPGAVLGKHHTYIHKLITHTTQLTSYIQYTKHILGIITCFCCCIRK